MSDSPIRTNMPAPPPSPIPPHARCVACRYELAGLVPEGLCPECAAPIEMTLEILRKAAENEAPFREMAQGLGAIKIAYIIAAIVAILVAAASLLDIDVISAIVALLSMLSILLVAGAVIFGHAALAIRLPGGEGVRRRLNYSFLTVAGMLGLILGPFVLLPAAVLLETSIILVPGLIAFPGGFLSILVGMVLLSKAIEYRTTPTNELHFSRVVVYTGLGLAGASASAAALIALYAFPWRLYGLFNALLVTTGVTLLFAHLALTITLSRAIKKAIRDLPPPAPPAAL